MLESLLKDTICGACYLMWMYPRTQSEVLKLIYGGRRVNQKPVIECRKKMLAAEYLIDLDRILLRNKRFVSTSKPYIEYLERTIERDKRRVEIDDEVRRAIDIIYDSNWFREIFKTDYILREDEHPMPAAGMYRDEKRLHAENAMDTVSTILNELAELSFLFEEYLRERGVEVRRPSVKDVLDSGDFDEIARKSRIDPKILREMYVKLLLDSLTPLAFVELNRDVLLIPEEIAELFVRAGRSAHTLRLNGPFALSTDILDVVEEAGIYGELAELAGGEEELRRDIERYIVEYVRRDLNLI